MATPSPKREPDRKQTPSAPSDEALLWRQVQAEENQKIEKLRADKGLAADVPYIGMALSGGGIRSATFGLGVLQALKQLGLLNYVQYLSTVSGGGYIGSWLVSSYYRGEAEAVLEDGSPAIHRLRQYSRYLSPRVGAISADSWTLISIWTRNASLIQTSVMLALATILLLPRLLLLPLFGTAGGDYGHLLASAVASLILLIIGVRFCLDQLNELRSGNKGSPERIVVMKAGLPILASAIASAIGISDAVHAGLTLAQQLMDAPSLREGFSNITPLQWGLHLEPCLVLTAFCWWVSFSAKEREVPYGVGAGPGVGPSIWVKLLTTVVPGFLGGVLFIGLGFVAVYLDENAIQWWPLIGPSLVLVAFSTVLTILIGLQGRDMVDQEREWWSRLGAWQLILAAGLLVIGVVAVAAPPLAEGGWRWAAKKVPGREWGPVVAWIATTAASVWAGRNAKTKGSGESEVSINGWLNALAKAGPYVYLSGVLLIVSLALAQAVAVHPIMQDGLKALWLMVLVLLLGSMAWWRFDLNEFSMNHMYRNRLVRCYLGAVNRRRDPNQFTGFDMTDDFRLSWLLDPPVLSANASGGHGDGTYPYTGPFPIVNTALNATQGDNLDEQDRRARSFVFTPLFSGFDGSRLKGEGDDLPAYRRTAKYIDKPYEQDAPDGAAHAARGVKYGTAVAISGAAASPNMGFHTSPGVAFLLTMFNVRLGWWVPNPARKYWQKPSPLWQIVYLTKELFGSADPRDPYVYLSDGGHFENLGVYELVRRGCEIVIACDAEQDGEFASEGLASVIRKCWIDFQVKIEIDVTPIRKRNSDGWNGTHFAVGTIEYKNSKVTKRGDAGTTRGTLIYLKSSLTGDEATDILQYKLANCTFPHESTSEQFFTEDQFESYRSLGKHIGLTALRDARGAGPAEVLNTATFWKRFVNTLEMRTAGAAAPDGMFTRHATSLMGLWSNLASDAELAHFDRELFPEWSLASQDLSLAGAFSSASSGARMAGLANPGALSNGARRKVFYYTRQMLQLMESVYLDFDLDNDKKWDNPDNRGWRILFERWSSSPTFAAAWTQNASTCGERFQNFCISRLKLPRP